MTDFFIPPEFDFGQQFDRPTLTRAMALDPERAVLSMRIDGPALLSRMRGSGVSAYEQRIELPVDRRLGLGVRGQCSCPMAMNCKHVAAALMAFEAYQIRRAKDPNALLMPPASVAAAAAAPPWIVQSLAPDTPPAPPSEAEVPGDVPTDAGRLPPVLARWLGEFADTANGLAPEVPAAPAAPPPPQLLYVLRAHATRLELQLYLGSVRKSGELGSVRPHGSALADMLRLRPAYLRDADVLVLAELLTLPLAPAPAVTIAALTGVFLLRGRRAAAVLRAVLATDRACLLRAGDALAAPLPAPATWLTAPLPLALNWRADAAGLWRATWQVASNDAAATNASTAQLALLPEPHAIDVDAGTVRPAVLDATTMAVAVAEWLARMPAVPSELLPAFVERLQDVSASRQLSLPLPAAYARPIEDRGALPLQPVLRFGTCPNLPFGEASAPAPTSARALTQASAQLLLRYRPSAAAASVDFHFPAAAADVAFADLPGAEALWRFRRDAAAEAAAVQTVCETLELRPWNQAAALAIDRLGRLNAGRLRAAVVPAAIDGKPMIFVARQAEQWLTLLARHVPALEAAGWEIEVDADFPFDTVTADGWQVEVGDSAGGSNWFDVGLQVSVDDQPVNLAPLLVGLVQGGWLADDAARSDGARDHDATGSPDDATADTRHVLLPWPGETAPAAAGAPPRQRLLRVPLARIRPLLDWLRSAFRVGDKGATLRLSRFDVATVAALAQDARVTAPPSFTELVEQVRTLGRGDGLPPVTPSPAVQATLRHYQLDGLAWMDFMRRARLGGVLADDMGLGKTLQTLALLQGELDADRLDLPTLVIVPTSLLGNWQSEAARFTPALRLLLLHGPQRVARFAEIAAAHVVVTSYPLAVRDIGVLAAQAWHFVVLDEAQRIKNSRSQAAMACKRLGARHRLCLSGTPLENHLGEVWSLLDFVCPGLLGSEAQFREHYRSPIEKRSDAGAAERLARRVRPFILRRTKQQVARELPEKTETLLRVELGPGQADLYETVRATMDKKLREAIARQGLARSQIMVLEALLKLRQVCCDPRLLKSGGASGGGAKPAPSAKLELLLDLLPTLVEDGRRVLLFSQFTEMLALIEPELAARRLGYLKLTGESRDRAGIVDAFQNGHAPLFLISLKAGGVGLNLTAADTVILYDPWWNPAVEQQAIDRAYRIGQDKPVFVYKLLASGTVEDKMLELQARKAGLAELLLSGVAADAALSADDFDELFKPLGAAGD